jgi:hypothetical protein
MPANIRSDKGVPFASAHALFNLSRLAVWWLRLGIGIERIKPGHRFSIDRHYEFLSGQRAGADRPVRSAIR